MIEVSKELAYTIISNPKDELNLKLPFSLLVLNRVNKFQMPSIIKNLVMSGFEEIISIEDYNSFYDVENLAKFNNLKTILLKDTENISVGEKINLGIKESSSEFVFVIWSDLELPALSQRLVNTIVDEKNLCTTVTFKNQRSELIPCIILPALQKNNINIKTINTIPTRENIKTLYPFDYVGIYNKEKFLQMDGFDESIESAYWQKVDFGLRAYLQREEIRNNFFLKVKTLINNIEVEDISLGEDYQKVFLKNMCIKFSTDHGFVPFSKFFDYLKVISNKDLVSAFFEFLRYKKYVNLNSFIFKTDCLSVIEDLKQMKGR